MDLGFLDPPLLDPRAKFGTLEVVAGDSAELLREKERRASPEYREAMRAEHEAQGLSELKATASPVTIGRLGGHSREWTRREAATELVENYAGEIFVVDGDVRVIAAPFAPAWSPDLSGQSLREVVEVCCEGRAAIATAAKGKDQIDPSKLPDRQVLPGGALL